MEWLAGREGVARGERHGTSGDPLGLVLQGPKLLP